MPVTPHNASWFYLEAIATLNRHISHIVSVSAKEKMIGTYTLRSITSMQDFESLWNGPMVKSIGQLRRAIVFAPVVDATVSVRSLCPVPQPAPVRFCNLAPKPINGSFQAGVVARNKTNCSAALTWRWQNGPASTFAKSLRKLYSCFHASIMPANKAVPASTTIVRLNRLSTSAGTRGWFCDTMSRHLKSPIQIWGVTVRAVSAAPGLLLA